MGGGRKGGSGWPGDFPRTYLKHDVGKEEHSVCKRKCCRCFKVSVSYVSITRICLARKINKKIANMFDIILGGKERRVSSRGCSTPSSPLVPSTLSSSASTGLPLTSYR